MKITLKMYHKTKISQSKMKITKNTKKKSQYEAVSKSPPLGATSFGEGGGTTGGDWILVYCNTNRSV